MVNKHIKRGLFAILAVLGLAIIAMPSANAVPNQGAPSGYDKYLVHLDVEASGYVEYKDEEGKTAYSDLVEMNATCTGFWVSTRGDIVTATHCFDQVMAREALSQMFLCNGMDEMECMMMGPTRQVEITNVFGAAGPGSLIDFKAFAWQRMDERGTVLSHDPVRVQIVAQTPMSSNDLALLRMTGLTKPTPALPIAYSSPEVGDEVRSVGYSGEVTGAMENNPMQRASVKFGQVSAHQVLASYGWPALEVDTIMTRGMSGGPVLHDGAVVGVVSHKLPEGDNYATDTESLRGFLKSHNVPFVEKAQVITRQYPSTSGGSDQSIATDNVMRVSVITVDWSLIGKLALASIMLTGAALVVISGIAMLSKRSSGRHSVSRQQAPAGVYPATCQPSPVDKH